MNDREWFRKATKTRPNRGYIYNDTFGQQCLILWPCSTEQFIGEFKRLFPDYKIDKEDTETFRMTKAKFLFHGQVNIIAFHGKPDIECVAHECLHLMVRVLVNTCLIPFTKETEEAHAYFMGWAVERIWEMVTKHK